MEENKAKEDPSHREKKKKGTLKMEHERKEDKISRTKVHGERSLHSAGSTEKDATTASVAVETIKAGKDKKRTDAGGRKR